MPTKLLLPEGVPAATETQVQQAQCQEVTDESEEPDTGESVEQDLETWRQDRPSYAILTLRAHHYYGGWLPLSKQVQRLFPPLAAGRQEVVFHHHFGDDAASFRAWVDREQDRIWVSPGMYEVLRQHRVYPGARLRLGARNESEYNIATCPTDKTEPVRVWRMWLEDGQIQYEGFEEPRRYDIDDDVYVADVRFEDQEALFRQAEERGNSIFGLMYQQAVEWWEAQKRQNLVVTADQLFQALHYDEQSRMTSPATIAWELWHRQAFEPIGDGYYLFQPEFGDRTRATFISRIGSSQQHGVIGEPVRSTIEVDLPPDVIAHLRKKYSMDDRLSGLFRWLWQEVKRRCNMTSCKATQRYIGFYKGGKIFAYIDLQTHRIKIGVFREHLNIIRPASMVAHHFPNWNTRGLEGITLEEKDLAIVGLLERCYHLTK